MQKRILNYMKVELSHYFFLELHGSPGFPKLTVGKVYALCLYIDNYRSYKQGHTNDTVS
jgi:hypothetical protein